MECVQCGQPMRLKSKTKSAHKNKLGTGKFKIRIYECEYCDYTESVYGTNGVDSDTIRKHEEIIDTVRDKNKPNPSRDCQSGE